MIRDENVGALMAMKDTLESKELTNVVDSARIDSPAKEIEDSLTQFVTARMSRLERDAQFGDMIKEQLALRFPEFTVDQLLTLNDQVARNNNRAVEGVMPLFQSGQDGKIITDHMKDTSTANTAQKLYDKADKDMLQALGYLNSVLAKVSTNSIVLGEVVDQKN